MVQTTGGLDALLLPLLIVVGIGIIAIAIWLYWALARRKSSTAAHASGRTPVPEPTLSESPLISEPPSASEPLYLVGLRRNGATQWMIDVEGVCYSTLDAVPDLATRDQVVSALRALADFSRGYIQKTKIAAADALRTAAPPVQVAGANPAALADGLVSRSRLSSRTVAPGATMPTIDLAQEIGDIVEEMLDRTPALQSHVIRLQNVPGQGIAFVVDGIRYRELSDIPDPEVQSLIREATKEWERR